MEQQVKQVDKFNIAMGLMAAAIGTLILLIALGVIHPTPARPTRGGDAPAWVVAIAGAMFVLGGLAVVLQTAVSNASTPEGEVPPGTPMWVRVLLYLAGLSIAVSLAVIASWIAFGSGTRGFSFSIPFLSGDLGETPGRVVFGFGAVMVWLILIIMAIAGARRLISGK
jgi:hypothetical protein